MAQKEVRGKFASAERQSVRKGCKRLQNFASEFRAVLLDNEVLEVSDQTLQRATGSAQTLTVDLEKTAKCEFIHKRLGTRIDI